MTLTYAAAHDLLEAYRNARTTYDGDAFTGLFADEAELTLDPFTPPLAGHNALRAYLLDAAASQRDVEFTVERHWVSGTTVLAAWHATFVRQPGGKYARLAGFLTAEMAADGRASRFRQWTVHAPETAG